MGRPRRGSHDRRPLGPSPQMSSSPAFAPIGTPPMALSAAAAAAAAASASGSPMMSPVMGSLGSHGLFGMGGMDAYGPPLLSLHSLAPPSGGYQAPYARNSLFE
jgi:hypothetical protein